MTWFEVMQIITSAVPAILAVLGTLIVAHRSYRDLQTTVAALVTAMEALKPQVDEITNLAKLYADLKLSVMKMQRDIELIKRDIATMRENQQAAAFGQPQKGKLEKLSTEKAEARPPEPPSSELEGRVDDLEDGIIKDLRIHKVDDPPDES